MGQHPRSASVRGMYLVVHHPFTVLRILVFPETVTRRRAFPFLSFGSGLYARAALATDVNQNLIAS
jgi:hypothetical protein